MICPNCGKVIPPKNLICIFCGTPVPAEEPEIPDPTPEPEEEPLNTAKIENYEPPRTSESIIKEWRKGSISAKVSSAMSIIYLIWSFLLLAVALVFAFTASKGPGVLAKIPFLADFVNQIEANGDDLEVVLPLIKSTFIPPVLWYLVLYIVFLSIITMLSYLNAFSLGKWVVEHKIDYRRSLSIGRSDRRMRIQNRALALAVAVEENPSIKNLCYIHAVYSAGWGVAVILSTRRLFDACLNVEFIEALVYSGNVGEILKRFFFQGIGLVWILVLVIGLMISIVLKSIISKPVKEMTR